MTSVRKTGLYRGEDRVDEYLIKQVAECVNHEKIRSLSRDLGVEKETVYGKLYHDKEKAFKV